MANELTINEVAKGYFAIYCNVCGKHVEAIGWETPVHCIRTLNDYRTRMVPTGEVRITIECHGETFTESIWR